MYDIGADSIEVRCWRDPVVERVGFDACGDYAELFWLPIIGPTSTWLLRRLAMMAVLHPEGCVLGATSTAMSLGLGTDTSARGSLARSLHRLSIFGLVRWTGGSVDVRTMVPPLTLKHLGRLPEHLQRAHSVWSESDASAAYEAAYEADSAPAQVRSTTPRVADEPTRADVIVSASAS